MLGYVSPGHSAHNAAKVVKGGDSPGPPPGSGLAALGFYRHPGVYDTCGVIHHGVLTRWSRSLRDDCLDVIRPCAHVRSTSDLGQG